MSKPRYFTRVEMVYIRICVTLIVCILAVLAVGAAVHAVDNLGYGAIK